MATVQSGGRSLFGVLKNRWVIYKDPWYSADAALMGYKGQTFLDAGYVYAPYIPLYVTPLIIDPNDFRPRRGMMTRFAKKMVVSEMYATISVETSS